MQYEQTQEERARYVEAWNRTMVKIWQERITHYGVFETPRRASRASEQHLFDALRYFPVSHDRRYVELAIHFTFPEYGVWQDRGVGREKNRGNGGDIGLTTAAGNARKIRQPRPWFSVKWYASCMNLKEFMARSVSRQFVGILMDSLDNITPPSPRR